MKDSHSAFSRACRVLPGGVNSPVRAFKAVGGEPVFIERAKGPFLYDSQGKRYIDYVLSWGPMILGHADDDVLAAVRERMEYGLSFGAPTEIETELAELICSIMPGMDKVRFCSSGTEATMSALRVARGFTGRDNIVKFEGCYHGHSDSLLIKAGSGALTFGVPSSPGVPACLAQHTLTLPFNDSEQVRALFAEKGDSIAAVIVEPVAGNMNCIPPASGFLETLRDECSRSGAVLIFDEVMTGFRIGVSGAQGHYDVQPDLTTLGKVIGGGMPVGAFGGRGDIMSQVSPEGPIYQAGTLSGNPVAMAAGLNTIRRLQAPDFYKKLFAKVDYLCAQLEAAAKRCDVPFVTNHVGSMWGGFFTEEENVENFQQVMACDTERFNRFFHGMLERGVYLAPASYEAGFMSISHSDEILDETVTHAEAVFATLRN